MQHEKWRGTFGENFAIRGNAKIGQALGGGPTGHGGGPDLLSPFPQHTIEHKSENHHTTSEQIEGSPENVSRLPPPQKCLDWPPLL